MLPLNVFLLSIIISLSSFQMNPVYAIIMYIQIYIYGGHMKYTRKQMVCDELKSHELELLEWFDTKPHGFFSHETKMHWLEVMRKEKEDAKYERKNPN